MVLQRKLACRDQYESHRKIDENRGERKYQVDPGMLPLGVGKPKQRHQTFKQPKEDDSTHQYCTSVGGWHLTEIINNGFHVIIYE